MTLKHLRISAFQPVPELAQLMNDLRYVTTFGVEVRYPGTAAHQSDAVRSIGTVHQVHKLIQRRLGT
jgi:hypothetical protein